MAGIYIPMELPMSCYDCKFRMGVGCCGNLPHNTRMPNCPLVHVPEHGRLIDADALISVLAFLQDKGYDPVVWEQMRYIAEDMPTIIPADKEKDDAI